MTNASRFDFPRWKAKDCWCAVEAHFDNGAGTMSPSLFLQMRPILWLCIVTTKSLLNYMTYKTNIHWGSVDVHFQNGSGSVWLSLLHIQPAGTSFMTGRNQSPLGLPMKQDSKLLTFHWLSFCLGRIHHMLPYNLAYYIIDGLLPAFLSSSCAFSFITTLLFNNTINISLKYTLKWLLIGDTITVKNCVQLHQCSSSLSGSLNGLLSSALWMSAALPHSR